MRHTQYKIVVMEIVIFTIPSLSRGKDVALPTISFRLGPGIRSIVCTREEDSHLWWAKNSTNKSNKTTARYASNMVYSRLVKFLDVIQQTWGWLCNKMGHSRLAAAI